MIVGLAGCAQQQLDAQRKAALERYQASAAACANQFPSEVGKYAARAKCINDAHQQYVVDANATDGDLVEIELTTRDKLGAMLDRREISKEDANLQFAQIHSNMIQGMLAASNLANPPLKQPGHGAPPAP